MENFLKDFEKTNIKRSSVITVYLKKNQMTALAILKDKNINVSKICRYAIEDAAKKIVDGKNITSNAYSNEIIDECIENLKKLKNLC